jgi:hypothetical protein
LAQHSGDEMINKELWSFYKIQDFKDWTQYILENAIQEKISIYLNIVVTKINVFSLHNYIQLLIDIGFTNILPSRDYADGSISHKISFWFVQPNGYAELNKEKVLLTYSDEEIKEIDKVVQLCKNNKILPDFHFVCPPICVLDYPEYNLEHERLKKLERDTEQWDINESNLESYKFLWKEKRKFDECNQCKNNKYCLGFYKNWVEFVWEEYVKEKINHFVLIK